MTYYTFSIPSPRRIWPKVIPIAVVLLACAALSASAWRGAALSAGGEAPPDAAEDARGAERLKAELITLRPAGFEPAVLERAGGHFILALDNRSGLEELTLRLDRKGGSPEREVKFVRRMRWRGRVNLGPGDYTLSVVERPGWVCRITIN